MEMDEQDDLNPFPRTKTIHDHMEINEQGDITILLLVTFKTTLNQSKLWMLLPYAKPSNGLAVPAKLPKPSWMNRTEHQQPH